MSSIKVSLVSLLLFFCTHFAFSQTIQWSTFVDSITVLSSPRPAELTGDSVLDIVIGGGVEHMASNYGVLAFDGANGDLLWYVPTREEMFTSPVFNDITNDSVPDIFIGGRGAEMRAIDGVDGSVIWEFFPQGDSIDPSDSGWHNFYSAQIIMDQNSDGIYDLLVANGGDHHALPWDTMRPPGHIMILDGLTGGIIADAIVPDSQETYCSPIIVDVKNTGNYSIIFGTGGETTRGSMWLAPLSGLLSNDLSSAVALVTHQSKGFIAPAAVADLDNDNNWDIIIQGFDGTIYAIDGNINSLMWSVNILGSESSTSPTIGDFTGSSAPDVFAVTYKGVAPTYFDYYQVMIDGETGQIAWIDSLSDLHYAAPNAFDMNNDGSDEIMMSLNNFAGGHFKHELKMIDFQNDTVFSYHTPEGGVGLASTPWVGDVNFDGKVDIVFSYRADSINPVGVGGIYVKQISTVINMPCPDIAWGSYMGTGFDGYFRDSSNVCGSIMLNEVKTDVTCNGLSDGAIEVSPTGGIPPYTYYWDNGGIIDSIGSLGAGSYSVIVIDAVCCIWDSSISINEPTQLLIDSVSVTDASSGDCDGFVIVYPSGGTGPYTYVWSDILFDPLAACSGDFGLIVYDSNACSVSDSVTVGIMIGLDRTGSASGFQIVATPSNHSLDIIDHDISLGSYNFRIYDITGRLIRSGDNIQKKRFTILMREEPQGIYQIVLTRAETLKALKFWFQ